MTAETLIENLKQTPLTLVTSDGGRYEVRGADYWHKHPTDDLLIVISPAGGVALVPIEHISPIRLKQSIEESA